MAETIKIVDKGDKVAKADKAETISEVVDHKTIVTITTFHNHRDETLTGIAVVTTVVLVAAASMVN